MEATATTSVIHKVSRAVLFHDGAGLTDGRLLDFFIDHRDDDAFAALVRRHGPMVWGVCRRLLDRQDAEDAFQATFLVLVRKAASVVPREHVGNWLYGVARQTALQARRTTARRKRREKQAADLPEPVVREDADWRGLHLLLDRELSRLPDRYRTVIVLCDLGGNTRKEAARQLGVPEGSVAGWLARGRAMLAKRLARQGLALSAGALGTVLAQTVTASPPSPVVSSTIKAASVYTAGLVAATGPISVKVAALTEGVLKAMMASKIKIVTAVLLAVVCLVGTVAFWSPAVGHPPPAETGGGDAKPVGQPPTAEKNDGNTKATAGGRRQETDQTKLQGRWEVVSIAGDGKVFSKADGPNELKDLDDVLIEGDRLLPTKTDEFNWHGKFALDVSRDPKQITIHREWLGGKLIFRGIYSIEGDVFKMCINGEGTDVCRPEEFVTRKGSPVFIITFKKVPIKK